jgi:hypothetical protein
MKNKLGAGRHFSQKGNLPLPSKQEGKVWKSCENDVEGHKAAAFHAQKSTEP